jgi:hypothetical protein
MDDRRRAKCSDDVSYTELTVRNTAAAAFSSGRARNELVRGARHDGHGHADGG